VVDKQRPMLASKCWMWLERMIGWLLEKRCARARENECIRRGDAVWVVGKRARVPGCKYMDYILENVSMPAQMEGIMGALKGDIKNVG
jgi:hypothetical protein